MYLTVSLSSPVGVLDQVVTRNEKFPFSSFWCSLCDEKSFGQKEVCKVRTSFG
jgi:hypothetical protein